MNVGNVIFNSELSVNAVRSYQIVYVVLLDWLKRLRVGFGVNGGHSEHTL
jgi:hypothetical protein